jgi:hypothetical protein
MNEHIRDRAGFLASLAEDDPERRLAEEHARACAPCAAAMAEGQHLFALLGEATPIAPPTSASLQRAAAAIERECRLEQRSFVALRWAAAAMVVLVWLLQLAYGKKLARDVNSVTLSLGVLVLVLIGVTVLRAKQGLVAGAMILTSGLFASLMRAASGLEPRAGVECAACEVVAGALSWLVVTRLAKHRRLALDRATTMAIAAAGALASQAAQLLSCPSARANPHLVVFHFGGVLLAAAFGALNPVADQRPAVA